MKKLILSLVAAIVAATATFAQGSLLATLSHDGDITAYYGTNALREAYAAAVSGDIITLGSGTFNAVDIAKGITIRGAGMTPTGNSLPTIISGDFTIGSIDNLSLTLEGIYHNNTIYYNAAVDKVNLLKSRFKTITTNDSGCKLTNLTMIHCRIADWFNAGYPDGSASCTNCIFDKIPYWGTYEFINCFIKADNDDRIENSSFQNCILYGGNMNKLKSSNVVFNCVAANNGDALFANISNSTNVSKECSEVFKTYRDGASVTDDETFELTDDAKTTLLGNDGTQVGIYGGNLPYDPTPSNPQITKCVVAAKSTDDGKLSVDITVNSAE